MESLFSQKSDMEATTPTQAVLLHNVALASASQNAVAVSALTDPLLLSHWYHLQFQRLQSEQFSNYLDYARRLIYTPSGIEIPVAQVTPPPWLPQLSRPAESSRSPMNLVKDRKASSKTQQGIKAKVHHCHHSDCNYSTDRRSNLNRHILAMHERQITSRSSHYCCGIHFENKAKQRLHARSVHSQGYKCPLRDCGKRFQRKTLLDRHMATHDPSLRKHECGTCGYRTANKSNLHRHDEKHCK